MYIFVSSHVLANAANTAPVPGYRRDPPRCFVFSSSAAPTAPPRSALLASPGSHQFHLNRKVPQRTPVIGSYYADDDGENDVDDYAGASGRGISPCRPRKDTEGRPYYHPHDYSLFRRQCKFWSIWRPRTTTSPITKIPRPPTMQVARLLHP